MAKTIANQASPSQVLGRAATLLRLLEEEGLPYDAWQIPIDEPQKRSRLVAYWNAGMPPLQPEELPKPVVEIADSESQAECRELFGDDFFGIQEAAGPYGYAFSDAELEERKAVRILARDGSILSEDTSWDLIRRCREEAPGQFVCCAGVPHSVCDAFAAHQEVFHPDFRRKAWFTYRDQRAKWSEKNLPDFWFLLRKYVVPKSGDKSSSDQALWLPKVHPHERFAEPQHIVYGNVLCEKAKGLLLYCSKHWGRTLSRAAGGLVCVGRNPGGLSVSSWLGGPRWCYGVPSLWTSEPCP